MDDLSSPLPGSEPAEPRYRVIVLSTCNEVIRTERLSASSDDEALSLIRPMVDGHALELWDGVRFIERFNPSD
ncbi:hypothetical protein [Methylobacterium nigriterrae]|uniref:hypothetical protein n=1 Tax=Methylobacterium nigriterrae TaxID=3127512 RepID=UPI00301341E3